MLQILFLSLPSNFMCFYYLQNLKSFYLVKSLDFFIVYMPKILLNQRSNQYLPIFPQIFFTIYYLRFIEQTFFPTIL